MENLSEVLVGRVGGGLRKHLVYADPNIRYATFKFKPWVFSGRHMLRVHSIALALCREYNLGSRRDFVFPESFLDGKLGQVWFHPASHKRLLETSLNLLERTRTYADYSPNGHGEFVVYPTVKNAFSKLAVFRLRQFLNKVVRDHNSVVPEKHQLTLVVTTLVHGKATSVVVSFRRKSEKQKLLG